MMNMIKNQINQDKIHTENGALSYRTSGHDLLDLNFAVSSLRSKPEAEIRQRFRLAFYENPELAVRWLFYLRDIRGGMGERRSFRIMMQELANLRPEETARLIPIIAEYGRWDDVVNLSSEKAVKEACYRTIQEQLKSDIINAKENKPISLLAKWMPSAKPKRDSDKKFVKDFIEYSLIDLRAYNRTIVKLRRRLDIVEAKMSRNDWEDINYNAVPARANLKYNNAFLRHDEQRRRDYLSKLKSGDKSVKINAGTLFPCDIVHNYHTGNGWWGSGIKGYDETLEQLWKNIPNIVPENGDVIVVADGSGSMYSQVGKSSTEAIEVANSLAIYFAERLSGPYKDQYITFSSRPQYVDFSNAESLRDKIKIAEMHDEMANTNIKATFDLILDTAVTNNLKQEDIPSTVMILSDMEFDSCGGRYAHFDRIKLDWEAAGYKMPKLVFWNICGRTGGIPLQMNKNGVVLLSGFSPAVYKMAMNNETDPYKALIRVLMDTRYDAVETAWKSKD